MQSGLRKALIYLLNFVHSFAKMSNVRPTDETKNYRAGAAGTKGTTGNFTFRQLIDPMLFPSYTHLPA